MAIESRRIFLRAVLGAAGGAAATALSACQATVLQPGEETAETSGAITASALVPEIVPLRAGVRYANAVPARVAAVRTLPSAGSMYAQ
jgi:hypothetical protein